MLSTRLFDGEDATGWRVELFLSPPDVEDSDDVEPPLRDTFVDLSLLGDASEDVVERSERGLLGAERETRSLLDVFRSPAGALDEREILSPSDALLVLDGLRSARSPEPVSRAIQNSYGVTVTVPTAPVALSDPIHISSSRTTVSTPALENTMPGTRP